MNLVINDVDEAVNSQTSYGMLWSEDRLCAPQKWRGLLADGDAAGPQPDVRPLSGPRRVGRADDQAVAFRRRFFHAQPADIAPIAMIARTAEPGSGTD